MNADLFAAVSAVIIYLGLGVFIWRRMRRAHCAFPAVTQPKDGSQ